MESVATIPTVSVGMFGDYTCPWCYVGTERLGKVKRQLAEEVNLDVKWRPFEVHPNVPTEGITLIRLGYPSDVLDAMIDKLRRIGAQDGLDFKKRIAMGQVVNTHRVLMASQYVQAEQPDRFETFHRALFHAFFTEGKDIARPAVMREIAEASGLDFARIESAMDAETYESSLEGATVEAERRGITSTPTFVFADHYVVVGVQSVAALEHTVRQVSEAAKCQAVRPS